MFKKIREADHLPRYCLTRWRSPNC